VVEIPQDLDEFNDDEGHAPEIDKEDVVEILQTFIAEREHRRN